MSTNFRKLLASLIWLGVGAAAGYFVAHPFGMPAAAFSFLYDMAHPILGRLQGQTYADLGLAAFVYAMPTILVFGLCLGLVLHRVQHKRVLVYSILIWPLYYFIKNTVFISLLKRGEAITGQAATASGFLSDKFGAEFALYFLEYSFLLIVIFTMYSVIGWRKPHNSSLDTVASRRSA